tara:strand:+ start:51092 stop:52519 length:1428 start_codon:yes stop_codon:yes gene_type:complete
MINKMMIRISFLFFIFYFISIKAQNEYTLEECVNLAIEKNISIKQSIIDLENASIDKSNAIGNFLPQISAQSQHIWNYGLSQNITTGLIENLTTQFTSVGLNLGIDVYNGKRNLNQIYRANLNLLANEFRLQDMKDDISLFVANSYLQVMFNKELLEVQKLQIELTREQIERTKKQILAGVLVPSDILESEANLASQEQALIQAENNYRLSKINLAQSLLITDYENFDIAEENLDVPISLILDQKPKAIYEKALTFRSDVQLGITNIEIAETDINLAKSSLKPSLSAFIGYSGRITYSDRLSPNGNFDEFPVGFVKNTGEIVTTSVPQRSVVGPLSFIEQLYKNDGLAYGLNMNIPIFNGFSLKNNVKRSKLNLERVKNQLEQTKLDLENTINQAYNNAKGAYKLYEAAQKTLISRKESYQYAEKRFELGALNSFDFIQAKQRYEISVSDLIRAKFDYIFKIKVLEFYFGIDVKI